jgi:hypothetical protein
LSGYGFTLNNLLLNYLLRHVTAGNATKALLDHPLQPPTFIVTVRRDESALFQASIFSGEAPSGFATVWQSHFSGTSSFFI